MNNPEELKRIYLSTTVSEKAVDDSWEELASRLPSQKQPIIFSYSRYATVAVALLLITITVIFSSQKAKPNSPLFMLKVLSQQALHTITGEKGPIINPETIHSTIKPAISKPTKGPSLSPSNSSNHQVSVSVTPTARPHSNLINQSSSTPSTKNSSTDHSPDNTVTNHGQEVKSEKTENLPSSKENSGSNNPQGQSNSHSSNGKDK